MRMGRSSSILLKWKQRDWPQLKVHFSFLLTNMYCIVHSVSWELIHRHRWQNSVVTTSVMWRECESLVHIFLLSWHCTLNTQTPDLRSTWSHMTSYQCSFVWLHRISRWANTAKSLLFDREARWLRAEQRRDEEKEHLVEKGVGSQVVRCQKKEGRAAH